MGVAGAQPQEFSVTQQSELRLPGWSWLISSNPERLETLNAVGLPESVLAGWQALPVSAPSPSRQAVATSAPVYLPTLADLAARYPDGYQGARPFRIRP